MKKFWVPVFFAVIAFAATTGFTQAVLKGATVQRTVSPDTIYYEGSPIGPTRATVTLKGCFSNTTVQKHQFFGAQPSSQSNSHIHT